MNEQEKRAVHLAIQQAFAVEINALWSEGYELLDPPGEQQVTIEKYLKIKADAVLNRAEFILAEGSLDE